MAEVQSFVASYAVPARDQILRPQRRECGKLGTSDNFVRWIIFKSAKFHESEKAQLVLNFVTATLYESGAAPGA